MRTLFELVQSLSLKSMPFSNIETKILRIDDADSYWHLDVKQSSN